MLRDIYDVKAEVRNTDYEAILPTSQKYYNFGTYISKSLIGIRKKGQESKNIYDI